MKKEITLDTKIADLLNDYEGMKDILIEINPKFKKLNNPILRRTLAKVATVKQASIVGGMKPLELLNRLREAVGQPIIRDDEVEEEKEKEQNAPEWIGENPKEILDANQLLDEEKNPLAEANRALKRLRDGDILLIKSDFKPEPLIDEFLKRGYEVYSSSVDEEQFFTYIRV
jgi:TusA-related sulfurtransferase